MSSTLRALKPVNRNTQVEDNSSNSLGKLRVGRKRYLKGFRPLQIRRTMTTTANEQQITQVINRLDLIKVELIRLRATLLPEEELTPEEKRELEKSRRDIEEGLRLNCLIPLFLS